MLAGLSKTSVNQSTVYIALICAALAAGIFVVDIQSLPLGVAAGVAYVGVVFIALWLPKQQHTFIVAGGVSALTVLGFLLSEPAGIPWMVIANRLLALYAIWLTAIAGTWLVLTKHKKSEADLQKVEQEADRARNAKSRFLNTASNDMRHHLQTLSLLNGALRKTVTQAKAQEMFAMQGDALAQLSDLLNSLLEISEFESGEVEVKIAETPIQGIFQLLQDEFEYQAQAKDLQMEFESHSEVALSDGMLLTRILRVLLSNAIRYTNQGEVKISCRRESGGLRIAVQDSGIGMASDQLAMIFDEFYRIDNDPAARDSGLGLGLSIVERSAKLLETTVDVESEPGRGSSFSLVVPAAA
ncbi:MAG: HAMP domain-containing histidine kinase [Woeseiaceae bacterium]|nr:HAMP domain-containing histidine kinase [Woeseiaceae bacterium]